MATPTLNDFSAHIRNSNIARPYLYFVSLTLPPALISKVSMPELSKISLFCHGAQTPMLNFSTNDSYVEAGIKRRFAYDYDYQDLLLQFYVDQSFLIQRFFDLWKESMVRSRRNFEYPDDYTANNLDLYLIDMEGEIMHSYSYRKIHPKQISNVTLDYGSTGIMTLPISFVFETVISSADAPPSDLVSNAFEIKKANAVGNTELVQDLMKTYNTNSARTIASGLGGDFGGGGASGSF